MKIAIHQPNFMPWASFFDKMKDVDMFVILTECQFEKGGFQNRFNINDKWFTMSVSSGHQSSILDKKYLNPEKDWKDIYSRLKKYRKILDRFTQFVDPSLSKMNTRIILEISKILFGKVNVVLDYPTTLTSTDRLVDICNHFKATTYLAGSSGANYMDLEKFKQAGVTVEFQTPKDTRPILEVLNEKLR